MTRLMLSLAVCALVLGHGTLPAHAAGKLADKTQMPAGKDVAFRKGSCKTEGVQASANAGKTWLNKGACGSWGLDDDQIALVRGAKAMCFVYLDYNNGAMVETWGIDCEPRA